MHKKHLYKFLLFSIIVISCLSGVQYLIEYVLHKNDLHNSGKINIVMHEKLDEELVIWGASTAQSNINPQILESNLKTSVFNMGISGNAFIQYRGVLNKFANYAHRCKYVIIALNAFELTERKSIYWIHEYLHHLDQSTIYEALHDIDAELTWKSRFIPFYKLTIYDKHSIKYFRRGLNNVLSDQYIHSNKLKGFEPIRGSWIGQMMKASDTLNAPIQNSVIQKLEKSIFLLNSKNIKVILVLTPLFHKASQNLKNKVKLEQKLESLVNEQTYFFSYLDDSLNYNQSYFQDNTHLLQSGADVFSRVLATDIEKVLF